MSFGLLPGGCRRVQAMIFLVLFLVLCSSSRASAGSGVGGQLLPGTQVVVPPSLEPTLIHLTSPRGDFRAVLSTYGACLLSYQSLAVVGSGLLSPPSWHEHLGCRLDNLPDPASVNPATGAPYPWCCGSPLCWPVFADDGQTGVRLLEPKTGNNDKQWGGGGGGTAKGVPMHGIARYMPFGVVGRGTSSRVTLELKSSTLTKCLWDAKFSLTYDLELKDDGRLSITVKVTNEGTEEFRQQFGMHTYFPCERLKDLSVARLCGPDDASSFSGVPFIDKTDGHRLKKESKRLLTFGSRPLDSVYLGVSSVLVSNSVSGKSICVRGTNLRDVVVFSPMGRTDMGADKFVCVESVDYRPTLLKPGDSWEGGVEFEVTKNDA